MPARLTLLPLALVGCGRPCGSWLYGGGSIDVVVAGRTLSFDATSRDDLEAGVLDTAVEGEPVAAGGSVSVSETDPEALRLEVYGTPQELGFGCGEGTQTLHVSFSALGEDEDAGGLGSIRVTATEGPGTLQADLDGLEVTFDPEEPWHGVATHSNVVFLVDEPPRDGPASCTLPAPGPLTVRWSLDPEPVDATERCAEPLFSLSIGGVAG